MKRLAALLVLACACQGPSPEPAPTAGEPAPAVEPVAVELAAPEQEPAEPTQDEPEPLDVPAARAEAATLLESGDPYSALAVLDEVHVAAPDDAGAWYLRGKAAFAAAELGQSAADFYLDAQGAYERAAGLGWGPDALVGASRAARMNLEPERSLELARAALEACEGADPRPELEQPLEPTLVEALFGLYVARRQAGEDAPELYAETEERLTAMAGSGRGDSYGDLWAWTQLANLYQWGGQADLAAQAQERVVDLSPDDQAAHTRLVDLARSAGGSDAVLAAYERFELAHPDTALGAWYRGVETFNTAVVALLADEESIPRFQAAEGLLARCRAIEPSYETSCKGYEVMCRNGVGWALFGQGKLEQAKAAFLSMEQVFPGGIDWQIEGSLMSGIAGLQFVADKYAQRARGEFDIEGKPEAAAVFDLLRELRPEDGNFANNAGLFHRDVCVILELEAQDRLRRADGWDYQRTSGDDVPIEEARWELVQVEVTPEQADELRAEAAELRAQATDHAHKSYRAYQAAARLSPDDVRVVNDAALVMVYHIRKDVAEMEALLARAIEMGAEQVADPDLSPEELDFLLEAWGDAHQNMGLVYLTLKDDPATARTWFERSFEIGPRPRIDRAWIEQVALPACDKAAAGDPDAMQGLDPRLWLHVNP